MITLTIRMYYDRCLFDFASVLYFPEFMIHYNYLFVPMIHHTAFGVIWY